MQWLLSWSLVVSSSPFNATPGLLLSPSLLPGFKLIPTRASQPYDESGTQRSSERVEKCGRAHSAIVASHSERSKHCWRRLTISHRARSHFSRSDVLGLKLATSQLAVTRWSAYGTTVTCEAPPHCEAARNLASTKASSSVLVFVDLSVMVFYCKFDEQFIAQTHPLE